MLKHITDAGLDWTPPPPLPVNRRNATDWTPRRRLQVLAGWPVRTPPGHRPLPRRARVLKSVTPEQLVALHEEAGRERLGLGSAYPELPVHLKPGAEHYLFPDPAAYFWPGPDRVWWECRLLLRMVDDESITGTLAVLPESFLALPSTVPRWRQRRLTLTARMRERDLGLWLRSSDARTRDSDPAR